MSLFSRDRRSGRSNQLVPRHVLLGLADFGESALGARIVGRPLTDERFGWADFFGPVSAALQDDRERSVGEVYEAAVTADAPESAAWGGYLLLFECDPQLTDERFLALQDAFLEHLRSLRLSSGHLTGYEATRWVATHGDVRSTFDGIYEVEIPPLEEDLEYQPLEPGRSRLIVRLGPAEDDNRFFAEHLAEGGYVVYSERIWSDEEPVMRRCGESQMGTFDSLPELLRAVGEMFGTPTYWADEDLMPYFTSRRG